MYSCPDGKYPDDKCLAAPDKNVRVGIYDPVKNVVSEDYSKEYNPSKIQGLAQLSSSFFNILYPGTGHNANHGSPHIWICG